MHTPPGGEKGTFPACIRPSLYSTFAEVEQQRSHFHTDPPFSVSWRGAAE